MWLATVESHVGQVVLASVVVGNPSSLRRVLCQVVSPSCEEEQEEEASSQVALVRPSFDPLAMVDVPSSADQTGFLRMVGVRRNSLTMLSFSYRFPCSRVS